MIADHRSLSHYILSGEADLAVVPPHAGSKEFQTKRLEPEEYILVGPAAWKRRALTNIIAAERIVDFHENDHLTLDFLQQFGLYQRAHQPRAYVNDTHLIAALVSAGLGYTVLTRDFAKPFLESGTLINLSPRRISRKEWLLAWNRRAFMPDHLQALIDSIR